MDTNENHDDDDGKMNGQSSPGIRSECHLRKRSNFDGYGFNLHSEKSKPGQFIGKIDANSPAEESGLRQGDRILEVNGKSIESFTHKQVVELIKADQEETKLIVLRQIISTDDLNRNTIDTDTANAANTDENNIATTDLDGTTNNTNKTDSQQQEITLNLSMTAAELRAKLAAKKKLDPKKQCIDFKQKFDIVQKL